MSRVMFSTGRRHQEKAARWVRCRLGDKAGRTFSEPDDQDGVILADGVGMGKTWEALAAAALILYKTGHEKGKRRVLVVCPANLITKWEDELAEGSKFTEKLSDWADNLLRTGHAASARVVMETLTQVYPIVVGRDVKIRQKYGKFRPSGGTYIVSHNLIAGTATHSRGLAALRGTDWDVIIVDEAHHSTAHKALQRLSASRRPRTKILLTATPFELSPPQVHRMTSFVLKGRHELLSKPSVKPYVSYLEAFFEDATKSVPPKVVRDASQTVRSLVARTVVSSSKRRYALLLMDGSQWALNGRLDQLGEQDVQNLLERARKCHVANTSAFESCYVKERLKLASDTIRKVDKTHKKPMISLRLRQHLSKSPHGCTPRLEALEQCMRSALVEDIEAAILDGLPRKTIVFTSLVGRKVDGEVTEIARVMRRAYNEALAQLRDKYGRKWDVWVRTGKERIVSKWNQNNEWACDSSWLRDELTTALVGASLRFWNKAHARMAAAYKSCYDVYKKNENSIVEDNHSVEYRATKRRLGDARTALCAWSSARICDPVDRYTGEENRSERNQAATAFKEMGQPWLLVASNVGAEGIDLQTFTKRIIHYDMEWNPAKMEQREGRGDRIGRQLNEAIRVIYCLVPNTYDERMFTQLIARDRWHGVLLGKPAMKLASEESEVRSERQERLNAMRLDLRPL